MLQITVLKIRDPCKRRYRKSPAIKLCRLKNNVDALCDESFRGCPVTARQQCLFQAFALARLVEHGTAQHQHSGDRLERRDILFIGIVTKEQYRLDAVRSVIGQDPHKIEQVVVAASPVPSADERKCNPNHASGLG